MPRQTSGFSSQASGKNGAQSGTKHLKKLLKEKERVRAILSQKRKGFPSRGRLAALLVPAFPVPVGVAVNLLDALACEFVEACESTLVSRFAWFSNPRGRAWLGCTEEPGCTSVNASMHKLPDTPHHSRPRRLARSYLVRLFHSLPFSG